MKICITLISLFLVACQPLHGRNDLLAVCDNGPEHTTYNTQAYLAATPAEVFCIADDIPEALFDRLHYSGDDMAASQVRKAFSLYAARGGISDIGDLAARVMTTSDKGERVTPETLFQERGKRGRHMMPTGAGRVGKFEYALARADIDEDLTPDFTAALKAGLQRRGVTCANRLPAERAATPAQTFRAVLKACVPSVEEAKWACESWYYYTTVWGEGSAMDMGRGLPLHVERPEPFPLRGCD